MEKNDPFAALRYPEFQAFFFARLFVVTAVFSQAVCVGWQIYELTKDPLSLGLIGLVEAMPYLLIALYAGYIVDHYNRKKILVSTVGLLTACSIILCYLSFDKSILLSLGTAPIYIIIFFTGLARGFISPTMSAIMTQLVPKKILGNSSIWNSTIGQIGMVAGPALGGLVYGFYGALNAYILNCFFFVIALFLFTRISKKEIIPQVDKEGMGKSITAGLRFVFSNQLFLGAFSLDLFAVFFGGAIALLPIFANEILKVGPQGLGLLRASPAFGACIMAIFLIYNPKPATASNKALPALASRGL